MRLLLTDQSNQPSSDELSELLANAHGSFNDDLIWNDLKHFFARQETQVAEGAIEGGEALEPILVKEAPVVAKEGSTLANILKGAVSNAGSIASALNKVVPASVKTTAENDANEAIDKLKSFFRRDINLAPEEVSDLAKRIISWAEFENDVKKAVAVLPQFFSSDPTAAL